MNQIAIMESKIEVLGKQVDDLRCCGNCGKYKYLHTIGCYHQKTKFPEDYCDEWESDGLTRKARE
jgi:hypothetical protein